MSEVKKYREVTHGEVCRICGNDGYQVYQIALVGMFNIINGSIEISVCDECKLVYFGDRSK